MACLMLAGADLPRHPYPMTQLRPGLSWVWNWVLPCTQAHCLRPRGTGLPQGYAECRRGGGGTVQSTADRAVAQAAPTGDSCPDTPHGAWAQT